MADLVLAADMSRPLSDYRQLPVAVAVVAGYVGGATPHAWTSGEVAAIRASGRAWWPIWTAPNPGVRLTVRQGQLDAAGMLAGLRALRIPPGTPCFYDIEQSTWAADPAGARACWQQWQQLLRAGGYARAWPYAPAAAAYGWQANWTGREPSSFPAGVVGVQYQGSSRHPGYDLSVFSLSRLGIATVSSPADIWNYPITVGSGEFLKRYGYSRSAYPARDLVNDTSWRTRDCQQRLAAISAAVAHLAGQPAAEVTAQDIVQALAAALAAGTGTPAGPADTPGQ